MKNDGFMPGWVEGLVCLVVLVAFLALVLSQGRM